MEKSNEKSFDKKPSKLKFLWMVTRYTLENKRWFKANKAKGVIAVLLTRCNTELGKMSFHDRLFPSRIQEYNAAVIEAEKAKYYWDQAMTSGDRKDWDRSTSHFKKSREIGEQLLEILQSGSSDLIPIVKPVFTSEDTEVKFTGGVPLVPEILPVIMITGTDEEMGYQYAQQVIQIYGTWIMQRKAGRSKTFTAEDLDCMHQWEAQIKKYAPEILGYCRGWAAGATDAGVPMSYEDVLDLWTGHQPPAKLPYNLNEIGLPGELASPFCSGLAAWGRATRDGSLVTASTGDHNPQQAATVIAFPNDGNAFIVMPFHVTGDIRSAPQMFMMGHPGMNNKGLAYVEHGGEPRLGEPMELWGYGLRKGTAIWHILRYANSAKEALEMELSFPVGDVGTVMGSVGGFWADSTYAFVPERRSEPVAIREAGHLGEVDFMYACNGALHRDFADVWWMKLNPENWHWDEHGGWRPIKYYNFNRGMMGDPMEMVRVSASMVQNGNFERCMYFYEQMTRGHGQVDADYMKMVLRNGGTPPEGDWDEIVRNFEKTGNWGKVSAAHSTNTITVVMEPKDGADGLFSLCHGEAKRGMVAFAPRQTVYMYNETNAFWEVKLAADPLRVVEHARSRAEELMKQAQDALTELDPSDAACQPLSEFFEQSRWAYAAGSSAREKARAENGNMALYAASRALRGFNQAQVLALQVIQAVIPPPCKPEDLGL